MCLPQDEAVLREYRLWLLKMASVYLWSRPDEWQDLAQEGWIAMWRALRAYDPARGALPSWLTGAARMRMKECASRETWTGSTGARGHVRNRPPVPVPDEMIVDRILEGALDDVEMAYHHGEIMEALCELTEATRIAIYRKFWLDETVPSGSWFHSKPRLRRRLGHLRS